MANKTRRIWINGHYKVTNEVYDVYIRQGRKMRYLERELKTERFIVDMEKQEVKIIPSREDSLERLLNNGRQFDDQRECVEEIVMRMVLTEQIHKAIESLSLEEQELITELFFKGRTESAYGDTIGISQVAVHKRKEQILKKLKIFFES